MVLQENVSFIDTQAFYGCTGLTEVVLSENLTFINGNAFCGCENLTKIIIPERVEMIGPGAFEACPNLTIYCRASEQPSGWTDGWNVWNCPVEWGYTGD